MSAIKTVYIVSHTHTDIGYTDHPEVLFRQHLEFIDRAIELCEATADYPEEAQYRWTCEVASSVERYFQSRPSGQIDRFLKLNREGRIAVAAMAYHWTPLLSPAAMVRSLYPAMRLRRQYGVRITSAMQCDVNGASWLWADLLPAIGIDGLIMSVNPYRGARPQPELCAFWWQGPGGGRLLTYNGPHYSYGLFFYGLGDVRLAEQVLPDVLNRLEQRAEYPYDFLYAQVTHPTRPDNGPPFEALSDFVRQWNEAGRSPRIKIITVDDFLAMLHARYAEQAPIWKGDWVDWWADGVASSAYETSLNRTTEVLLPALDLVAAQVGDLEPELIEEAYHRASLYDEHTWGAFNSITQPHLPFTRAQWNAKAGFAYSGYALTHELLARAGRRLAERITGQRPEGNGWRRWPHGEERSAVADAAKSLSENRSRTPSSGTEVGPGMGPRASLRIGIKQRFLVINSLSWTRHINVPVPLDRGGAAPYHFLEAFLTGNYRDSYPQSIAESQVADTTRTIEVLQAVLPAFGYRVLAPVVLPIPADVRTGEGILENRWYCIEVDVATGGLRRWYDKELGQELAGQEGPWRFGQYVYEWIDDPRGRQAMFSDDFTHESFGRQRRDTPFRRQGPFRVAIAPAWLDRRAVSLEVCLKAPGARSVRVRYSLPHYEKALHVDMVVDKEEQTEPEAIYVPFPLALTAPTFHLDLNGVALEPEVEQVPGSCRDWYSVQRWAEATDGEISVVMVPIDTPLLQLGGIRTGRWAARLEAHEATLVSWPVQNYWTTNFKASQGGELLLRYRFTSRPGYNSAAASRFAMECLVPPIVVRVPGASLDPSGQFLTVEPEGVADVQVKQAVDGRGLIVRLFNFTSQAQDFRLSFPTLSPVAACSCSPVEEDGASLVVADGSVMLTVPSRSLACARVVFNVLEDRD